MGKEKFFFILILVFGLGLRIVNLNQSLWLDEASQAVMSSKPIQEIWFGRGGDFHPPLFYILAHYWIQINKSEVWLRLLPLIFGILSIAAIYYAADKITEKKGVGIIAAFLLAINPFHIYYSQEFRTYSLIMLVAILAMWGFYKKHWSWHIFNALGLYSHYSYVFIVLAQFVYVLLFDRNYLKKFFFYSLLTTFYFLPWFPQFLKQLHGGVNIDTYLPGWRQVLTLPTVRAIPVIFLKFVSGRIDLRPEWLYWIYALFVWGVSLFTIFLARGKRRILYLWLIFPPVVSVVISLWIPMTQPFRLITVLPALIILFAEGATRYPRIVLTFLIYISIAGNAMYLTRPRLQREEWREAINYLKTQQMAVVVNFKDKFAPFYWYAPESPVTIKVPTNVTQFFYMEYLTGITDPEHKFQKDLENTWRVVETKNFEGVGLIYRYQKI